MSARPVAVLMAVLVAACAPAASQSPGVPTPGPTSTAVAPIPTPTATLAPTSEPTASPPASLPPTAWTQAFTLEGGAFRSIIESPNGFIATGTRCSDGPEDSGCAQPIVALSADGTAWEVIDVDVPSGSDLGGLQVVDDRLFAIGFGEYGPSGGAVVVTSRNGHTWTRVESGSFVERAIDGIIDSPKGTFAVGITAPVHSDNFSGFFVWPVHADGTFGKPRSVEIDSLWLLSSAIWTGDEFLAWGYGEGNSELDAVTAFVASTDGVTWKRRSEISTMRAWVDITTFDGRLVAVADERVGSTRFPRAWTSTDGGRTWVAAAVPDAPGNMRSVRQHGSVLIARGEEYIGDAQVEAAWLSTDGLSWTRLPDDQEMPAVAGFSGSWSATVGATMCTAGAIYAEEASTGAIYCRPAIAR